MAKDSQSENDLLRKTADEWKDNRSKRTEMLVTGKLPEKPPAFVLPDKLLDESALTKLAQDITETFKKHKTDVLINLQKQAETLASIQKEYYIIHNRPNRVGALAQAIAKHEHDSLDEGVVELNVGQAGGIQ